MHTTADPEADLYFPLPEDGEEWHPHTIHTYYFGFHIPEERIGAYLYLRAQPAFALCGGGVVIHRGTDNVLTLDAEFVDYETTMPWPKIEGQKVTLPNGLTFDFVTLGEEVNLTYEATDGRCTLDLNYKAVTPLVLRQKLMPGEDDHLIHPSRRPGGCEQFMHVTGTLALDGTEYPVDCFNARDRSWSQVRTETRGEVITPPIGWGPIFFDENLCMNQFGIEPIDTDPMWKRLGLFEGITEDSPAFHWAWIKVGDELRELKKVRRNVLEIDPAMYTSSKLELELTDETGQEHFFRGEVISMSEVFGWPNLVGHDGVARWETDDGRVGYGTYQEVWHDAYQRAMTAQRRRSSVG